MGDQGLTDGTRMVGRWDTNGWQMGDQELTDGGPRVDRWGPGLEVINLEIILRLKIKGNDWLLADRCPQAANQCALF